MRGVATRRASGLQEWALALALALAALGSAACGAGIAAALALSFGGSGGGGGGSHTSAEGVVDLPAPLPMSDRFIGALVVPNSVLVSQVELTRNGQLVPIDQNVASPARSALQQVLLRQGIFDPSTEYLEFWQTSAPLAVQDGDPIRLAFVQSEGGGPVAQSRIGFGGSNEADFQDGLPLASFQGHDNPFLGLVPALGGAARALVAVALTVVAFALLRGPRARTHLRT